MTFVRKNVWTLSTVANPWHPVLVAYANAVKVMRVRGLTDPTGWRYQAAIHGLANTAPPAGAPWNQCQHQTWYFLPWHRMYLYQFERIVRKAVLAANGPVGWALPYWNYGDNAAQRALPPAFRVPTMPDNTPNPLFIPQRRQSANQGIPMAAAIASSQVAMATPGFIANTFLQGFGGPQTGFSHGGALNGALESQPHNQVHVFVGGATGWMTDPDLAALDPIFWLHHANIDRLWTHWAVTHSNPTQVAWKNRNFSLRNDAGQAVATKVSAVTDTVASLDYTYDSLPAVAAAAVTPPPKRAGKLKPAMIGRSADTLHVPRSGGVSTVPLGALPGLGAAAAGSSRRYHLQLADVEGESNPGVIYGVYVNLPANPTDADLESHRVGLVSFFGIEHSTAAKSDKPMPLAYSFEVTELLARLGIAGNVELSVAVLPFYDDEGESASASTAALSAIRVGTVAVVAV